MGCGASSRKVHAEVEEVCLPRGVPGDLRYWQIPIPPEPPKLPTPKASNGNSHGSRSKRHLSVDTEFDESFASSSPPSSTENAPKGQPAGAQPESSQPAGGQPESSQPAGGQPESSQPAPPAVAKDKSAGTSTRPSKVLKPVTSVADLESLSVSELKAHLNHLKVQIPKGIVDKDELRQLFLEYVPWVDGSQTLKRNKRANSVSDLPLPEHCTREAFLRLSVGNLKKWINHFHVHGTYVDKLTLVDALFDTAGPSLHSAFPATSPYKWAQEGKHMEKDSSILSSTGTLLEDEDWILLRAVEVVVRRIQTRAIALTALLSGDLEKCCDSAEAEEIETFRGQLIALTDAVEKEELGLQLVLRDFGVNPEVCSDAFLEDITLQLQQLTRLFFGESDEKPADVGANDGALVVANVGLLHSQWFLNRFSNDSSSQKKHLFHDSPSKSHPGEYEPFDSFSECTSSSTDEERWEFAYEVVGADDHFVNEELRDNTALDNLVLVEGFERTLPRTVVLPPLPALIAHTSRPSSRGDNEKKPIVASMDVCYTESNGEGLASGATPNAPLAKSVVRTKKHKGRPPGGALRRALRALRTTWVPSLPPQTNVFEDAPPCDVELLTPVALFNAVTIEGTADKEKDKKQVFLERVENELRDVHDRLHIEVQNAIEQHKARLLSERTGGMGKIGYAERTLIATEQIQLEIGRQVIKEEAGFNENKSNHMTKVDSRLHVLKLAVTTCQHPSFSGPAELSAFPTWPKWSYIESMAAPNSTLAKLAALCPPATGDRNFSSHIARAIARQKDDLNTQLNTTSVTEAAGQQQRADHNNESHRGVAGAFATAKQVLAIDAKRANVDRSIEKLTEWEQALTTLLHQCKCDYEPMLALQNATVHEIAAFCAKDIDVGNDTHWAMVLRALHRAKEGDCVGSWDTVTMGKKSVDNIVFLREARKDELMTRTLGVKAMHSFREAKDVLKCAVDAKQDIGHWEDAVMEAMPGRLDERLVQLRHMRMLEMQHALHIGGRDAVLDDNTVTWLRQQLDLSLLHVAPLDLSFSICCSKTTTRVPESPDELEKHPLMKQFAVVLARLSARGVRRSVKSGDVSGDGSSPFPVWSPPAVEETTTYGAETALHSWLQEHPDARQRLDDEWKCLNRNIEASVGALNHDAINASRIEVARGEELLARERARIVVADICELDNWPREQLSISIVKVARDHISVYLEHLNQKPHQRGARKVMLKYAMLAFLSELDKQVDDCGSNTAAPSWRSADLKAVDALMSNFVLYQDENEDALLMQLKRRKEKELWDHARHTLSQLHKTLVDEANGDHNVHQIIDNYTIYVRDFLRERHRTCVTSAFTFATRVLGVAMAEWRRVQWHGTAAEQDTMYGAIYGALEDARHVVQAYAFGGNMWANMERGWRRYGGLVGKVGERGGKNDHETPPRTLAPNVTSSRTQWLASHLETTMKLEASLCFGDAFPRAEVQKKLAEKLARVDPEKAKAEHRMTAYSMRNQMRRIYDFLESESDTYEGKLMGKRRARERWRRSQNQERTEYALPQFGRSTSTRW